MVSQEKVEKPLTRRGKLEKKARPRGNLKKMGTREGKRSG